jgi:hypothetical protein
MRAMIEPVAAACCGPVRPQSASSVSRPTCVRHRPQAQLFDAHRSRPGELKRVDINGLHIARGLSRGFRARLLRQQVSGDALCCRLDVGRHHSQVEFALFAVQLLVDARAQQRSMAKCAPRFNTVRWRTWPPVRSLRTSR